MKAALTVFRNLTESEGGQDGEVRQVSRYMLFLLNDVILNLDAALKPPPLDARAMDALSLAAIERLGAELYAEEPLLHRKDEARAIRLALLIATKKSEINAALFAAPAKNCSPELVQVRYATLSLEAMAGLYAEHRANLLTPFTADRQVWRRMAA